MFWVRIILGFAFGAFLPTAAILVGGPAWAWQLLSFSVPPSVILVSGAVWFVVVAIPALAVTSAYYLTPRRIGIGTGGLNVETWLRSRIVAWSDLRPSPLPVYKEWGYMAAWRSGGRLSPAGTQGQSFPISREQATAIMEHPSAPVGLFPPEFWKWLGSQPPGRTTKQSD